MRAALDRGFLTVDQLREALLIRQQLRIAGRQMRLLALLGSRFIKLEHQAEISQVYFEHLNQQPLPDENEEPTVIMAEEMLFSSDDELAIPEFMLKSSAALARSAEEHVASEAASNPVAGEDEEETSESGLWRWLKRHLPGGGAE